MKQELFKGEGVVIGRRNWGEADRIVVIFTKQFGKMSVLAKGIRRVKSKKRGHMEMFSRFRFSGVFGHGLPLINEAELINNYFEIREKLKKTAVGYYFCEVIGKVTREGEPNPVLYDLLNYYLTKLVKTENLSEMRKEFVREMLVVLGFWPKNKILDDPDDYLEQVMEKKVNSVRVGKKMLS